MSEKISLALGESVIVKPNTQDPDLDIEIGGWQGRISEIDLDNALICIDWDSLTLKNMPSSVIAYCQAKDLDWDHMYLASTEVELITARDTSEDVAEMKTQLERQHYLGAEKAETITPILPDKTVSKESQKRDGCLLLLLTYYTLGGAALLIVYLTHLLLPDSNVLDNIPFVVAVWHTVVATLVVIFGVAALKWRKWGVFGLLMIIVIGNLVGFSLNTSPNILLFIIPLVQFALTVYLVRRKWDLFV